MENCPFGQLFQQGSNTFGFRALIRIHVAGDDAVQLMPPVAAIGPSVIQFVRTARAKQRLQQAQTTAQLIMGAPYKAIVRARQFAFYKPGMQMQAAILLLSRDPEQIGVAGIPRRKPMMIGIQRNDGVAKRIRNLQKASAQGIGQEIVNVGILAGWPRE